MIFVTRVVTALLLSTCLAHAAPQRIVSLNICTDELLLRLVEPSRIASVTWLSRDPALSNVAALAATVPVNHGSAEEVIPNAPDLVLVGVYTTAAATALLRKTGFQVAEFGIARSFDDVTAQIAEAGGLLGAEARGSELTASIARDLAAIPPTPDDRQRPRALVYNPKRSHGWQRHTRRRGDAARWIRKCGRAGRPRQLRAIAAGIAGKPQARLADRGQRWWHRTFARDRRVASSGLDAARQDDAHRRITGTAVGLCRPWPC